MADNPYIDNSVVGFDPISNLRFQVDTYNRLAPILDLKNNPMFTGNEPSILKNTFLSGDSPTKQKELPDISIADALSSDDPNIQEMGRRSSDEWMRKNIPEYNLGLGRTIETPYEYGKKYLNKKYGFDITRDNEDFYYQDYKDNTSWVGRNIIRNPLKFLGRFLGGTVAKIGESFGYMGSMITSIGQDNYFEKIADNGFSKWFENQEDWLKNDLIPVYKAAGFDDKGFFSKLADWSFWNDQVADAAAFMASAMVQTLATDGLGNLAGLGRLGSLEINTASKLGRFGRGLDGTVKFLTGADDVAGIANHAFNTASESFFESAGVFKETKQDLIDQRNRGENQYTDDDIEKIASQRAASDFKGNMLALTLSNAFENKYIFQPFKKFVKRSGEVSVGNTRATMNDFVADAEESLKAVPKEFTYSTKIKKFFDWNNPQSRARFYGTRALTSSLIEGFYEENIQLAMERMSRYGDYENKNTVDAILLTLAKSASQISQAVSGNDKEAAESIGLGALIGIAGTGAVGKLFGGTKFLQGERRAEISAAESALNTYNKLKKEFLSVGDIYKKDDKNQYVIEDGNLVYDDDKVKARADGLSDVLKKTVTADQIYNPVSRKLLQDDILSDFVHAAISANLYDTVHNKIAGLKNKSAEEIRALGFNPAEIKASPEQLIADIEKLYDEHKKAFDSVAMKPRDVSSKEFAENDPLRKFYIYKSRASAQAANNAYQTLDSFITEISASRPVTVDNDSAVREYNSLTFQLKGLEEFEKMVKQNTDFYNPHISERKKEINKRRGELKESLKDKVDSRQLVLTDDLLLTPRNTVAYKNNALDLSVEQKHATAKNAEMHYNYTADKLSSLTDGFDNFMNFKTYQDSLSKTDDNADEATDAETKGEEVKTPDNIVTETDDTTKDKPPTQTDIVTPTPQPPVSTTEDLGEQPPEPPHPPVDLSVDYIPDEIDPEKPITYKNPNITSKRDTDNLSDSEEKLTTDIYSLERGNIIKKALNIPAALASQKYRFFIVKDTFPEIYQFINNQQIVKQVDGKWQFIDPSVVGEVLIMQHVDGSVARIKDFSPNASKELLEMPLVFSFDQNVFFNENLYPERLAVKAKKEGRGISEVDEENRRWRAEADAAREEVRDGKKDKIEVELYHSTQGLHPKTKYSEPIDKRFGDFTFELAIPVVAGEKRVMGSSSKKEYGTKYAPGQIIFTIGKQDFPAFTGKLSEYPDIFSKVNAALEYKFDTVEEAQRIRNDFLSIVVNTGSKYFMTIDKDGDKFKINFRVLDEQYIGKDLSKADMRKLAVISNKLVGDAPLNISYIALQGGYLNYNPADPTNSEFATKEQYMNLVKPKILTKLKKIVDKDGNLYTEPVNPYFSFLVTKSNAVADIQKINHKNLRQRIATLVATGQADMQVIAKGLTSELNKGNITQEQYDDLKLFAEQYQPRAEGKVAKNFYEHQKELLDKGTINQNIYDLSIQIRLKNHPEEREMYENSLKGSPPVVSVENVKFPEEVTASDELEQKINTQPSEIKAQPPTVSTQPIEKKPAEVQKKSIADKYKNMEKVSVSDAMRKEQEKVLAYNIDDKYIYNPGDNRFSYVTSGRKVPNNQLPKLLEKMAEKYPYKETQAGNEGFAVFTEENVNIYRPPTPLPSPEIVVIDGKVTSVEEARKALAGNEKLTEFLNRYCK